MAVKAVEDAWQAWVKKRDENNHTVSEIAQGRGSYDQRLWNEFAEEARLFQIFIAAEQKNRRARKP